MTNNDSDPVWINARRTLAWGDRGEVEDIVQQSAQRLPTRNGPPCEGRLTLGANRQQPRATPLPPRPGQRRPPAAAAGRSVPWLHMAGQRWHWRRRPAARQRK